MRICDIPTRYLVPFRVSFVIDDDRDLAEGLAGGRYEYMGSRAYGSGNVAKIRHLATGTIHTVNGGVRVKAIKR